MSMTNRERVAVAFAHRQPDRTPVSLGTTIVAELPVRDGA